MKFPVMASLAIGVLAACSHCPAQANVSKESAPQVPELATPVPAPAPSVPRAPSTPPVAAESEPAASAASQPVNALPKTAPDLKPALRPDPLATKKNGSPVYAGFKDQAELGELPKLPLLLKGCENNCCSSLKSHKAPGEIELYDKPGDNTKEVRTLKAGEGIKSAVAFMMLRKYGTGTFTQVPKKGPNADLKNGEAFSIVRYAGETKLMVWAKGRVRVVTDENPDLMQYKIGKEAVVEPWIKITAADGTQGWALSPDLDWGACQSAGL